MGFHHQQPVFNKIKKTLPYSLFTNPTRTPNRNHLPVLQRNHTPSLDRLSQMIFHVALRPEAGASLSWCRSINGASVPDATLQGNHNPTISPNGKLKRKD